MVDRCRQVKERDLHLVETIAKFDILPAVAPEVFIKEPDLNDRFFSDRKVAGQKISPFELLPCPQARPDIRFAVGIDRQPFEGGVVSLFMGAQVLLDRKSTRLN